ncbi:MAG TPA: Fur family transcriptional regulator [Actinomycetales bacterium]|nr:Fur family transcriptional regulator [Actinomycetales bacterium]
MTLTVQERLRASGLRVTAPRSTVLQVLDDATRNHEHLTTAQVAGKVRDRLGSVSLQAIYDVLEVLVVAGLARRIEPAGQPALFDGRVGDNHHHLVCRSCGRTTDVDCAVGAAPCLIPSATGGFVVDEAEVVFWGRCPKCQNENPTQVEREERTI